MLLDHINGDGIGWQKNAFRFFCDIFFLYLNV